MAEMVQVKLLKKLYKNAVGDVIQLRSHEARALVAVGVAENYVASSRRPAVVTRVMEPAKTPEPIEPVTPPVETKVTEETTTVTTEPGATEPYARRDMQPRE